MNQIMEQQMECTTCQWNKNCVEPPSLTREEVKAKINDIGKEGKGEEGKMMGGLMAVMVFGGKDKECPACPVFIERLRESRELSEKIREIMKAK